MGCPVLTQDPKDSLSLESLSPTMSKTKTKVADRNPDEIAKDILGDAKAMGTILGKKDPTEQVKEFGVQGKIKNNDQKHKAGTQMLLWAAVTSFLFPSASKPADSPDDPPKTRVDEEAPSNSGGSSVTNAFKVLMGLLSNKSGTDSEEEFKTTLKSNDANAESIGYAMPIFRWMRSLRSKVTQQDEEITRLQKDKNDAAETAKAQAAKLAKAESDKQDVLKDWANEKARADKAEVELRTLQAAHEELKTKVKSGATPKPTKAIVHKGPFAGLDALAHGITACTAIRFLTGPRWLVQSATATVMDKTGKQIAKDTYSIADTTYNDDGHLVQTMPGTTSIRDMFNAESKFSYLQPELDLAVKRYTEQDDLRNSPSHNSLNEKLARTLIAFFRALLRCADTNIFPDHLGFRTQLDAIYQEDHASYSSTAAQKKKDRSKHGSWGQKKNVNEFVFKMVEDTVKAGASPTVMDIIDRAVKRRRPNNFFTWGSIGTTNLPKALLWQRRSNLLKTNLSKALLWQRRANLLKGAVWELRGKGRCPSFKGGLFLIEIEAN